MRVAWLLAVLVLPFGVPHANRAPDQALTVDAPHLVLTMEDSMGMLSIPLWSADLPFAVLVDERTGRTRIEYVDALGNPSSSIASGRAETWGVLTKGEFELMWRAAEDAGAFRTRATRGSA